MQLALVNFVGRTEAERLLGKKEKQDMGLLESLQAKKNPPTASGPVGMSAAQDPSVALPLVPPVDQAAEIARLQAEETAARAAREVKQFAGLLDRIDAFSLSNPQTSFGPLGTPMYSQGAAALYAAARNKPEVGVGYAGTGALGQKYNVTNLEMMADLVKQLEGLAAEGHIVAPPEAQPTTPAPVGLGALLSPETPPPSAPRPPAIGGMMVTTAGTPAADGAVMTPATAVAAGVTNPSPEEKPAAKKKSKKKDEEAPPAGEVPPPTGSGELTAFSLYVDCDVDLPGPAAKTLQPWLAQICAELANSQDSADVRCGKDGSALAFGKWKGAVAALVRERAEQQGLTGPHVLSTRGSEHAEIAADALHERCHKTGGTFVWGTRR